MRFQRREPTTGLSRPTLAVAGLLPPCAIRAPPSLSFATQPLRFPTKLRHPEPQGPVIDRRVKFDQEGFQDPTGLGKSVAAASGGRTPNGLDECLPRKWRNSSNCRRLRTQICATSLHCCEYKSLRVHLWH